MKTRVFIPYLLLIATEKICFYKLLLQIKLERCIFLHCLENLTRENFTSQYRILHVDRFLNHARKVEEKHANTHEKRRAMSLG